MIKHAGILWESYCWEPPQVWWGVGTEALRRVSDLQNKSHIKLVMVK